MAQGKKLFGRFEKVLAILVGVSAFVFAAPLAASPLIKHYITASQGKTLGLIALGSVIAFYILGIVLLFRIVLKSGSMAKEQVQNADRKPGKEADDNAGS